MTGVRTGEARRAKRRSRNFTRVISHKAVSGPQHARVRADFSLISLLPARPIVPIEAQPARHLR